MANTLKLILTVFSMMMGMLGGYAKGRHIIATPASERHPPVEEWFKNLNLAEEEKFTKLHFYIHDNQTAYNVAESAITSDSASYFGRVQVVDHLITVGPEIESEKVGRVQGIHAMADLHEAAISVNWNFLFNDGSTFAVSGRLVAFAQEGELSIVGGTGQYLMARGISFKRTLEMDPDTFNSIMKYNMYVYSCNPVGLMLRGL